MHLTISNQTQDDLRCSFRDSELEDRVLLVKANGRSVIFAAKCSLLVVSRHSWNDETKEPEAVYSVSIPTAPRVNTSGRWNLVKVPPDSEWIVYRNKVR
jgi:1-phosphatidylinositol phosphodiesterase